MKYLTSTALALLLAGSSSVLADEPIKIGVSMPITGPVAFGALQERHGLEIAVKEINDAGGVLGRKIELSFEDNQCNPSASVAVINKLISENVPAIIGAQCSSAVLAAMPVIEKAEIPMVSGIATSPAITEKAGVGGNPWIFRTNPSDRELAVTNVKYLKSLGDIQKVAVLAESTDYGRGGAEAFSAAAKANGLDVVSVDYYPIGNPDFTTMITRLRSSGAQALAVYQAPADRVNFVRQAFSQGFNIPLTGKIGFDGDMAKLIQAGALEASSSAYPYSPEIDTPANKNFVEKIIKAYGDKPSYETFAGYEELNVLAAAITAAGKVDPKAIREALTKVNYYSMIGGIVAFDDHNQAHNNAAVLVVKSGKVIVINVFPTN